MLITGGYALPTTLSGLAWSPVEVLFCNASQWNVWFEFVELEMKSFAFILRFFKPPIKTTCKHDTTCFYPIYLIYSSKCWAINRRFASSELIKHGVDRVSKHNFASDNFAGDLMQFDVRRMADWFNARVVVCVCVCKVQWCGGYTGWRAWCGGNVR